MRYLTIEPFENRNKQLRRIKNENGPLTTSTLCEIVNSAMEKIKKRKVFNASIRDEGSDLNWGKDLKNSLF